MSDTRPEFLFELWFPDGHTERRYASSYSESILLRKNGLGSPAPYQIVNLTLIEAMRKRITSNRRSL